MAPQPLTGATIHLFSGKSTVGSLNEVCVVMCIDCAGANSVLKLTRYDGLCIDCGARRSLRFLLRIRASPGDVK